MVDAKMREIMHAASVGKQQRCLAVLAVGYNSVVEFIYSIETLTPE